MTCSTTNITIEQRDQILMIRFAPLSDFSEPSLQAVERDLVGAIKDTDAASIVISFKGVPLISSHMLGVLVRLRELALKKRIAFQLTGLSEINLKLFELTRLDSIFQIFASEADALGRQGAA